MRLLGIIEKEDKELFLLHDKDRLFVGKDYKKTFSNYNLIRNRDTAIGTDKKSGEGVFNFRYGPVTAGVAEAGAFNILTYGERILSVEVDTSYKKRNIEKRMINKTPQEALKLAESVSGNFAFSHSLAFSKAIEGVLNIKPNQQTKRLRIIALELERIYNHIHVIAKLSKGAAQNILTSHLEWLFEECLRINKLFCANRFLKNINKIGTMDFSNEDKLDEIAKKIEVVKSKFEELYSHSLKSWNFVDRIYKTAVLTKGQALSIGITGPSLRACGVYCDLREFNEAYDNLKVTTKEDGDSLARMQVRAKEIINSCDIISNQIKRYGDSDNDFAEKKENESTGTGFSESPSGIVAYYVKLEKELISSIYISTPSLFGYKAFAESFVGYIFTDFSFALDSFGINFADCAR